VDARWLVGYRDTVGAVSTRASGDMMDETRAREILGKWVTGDNKLYSLGPYVSVRGQQLELEGDFDADTLEALAWWLRNRNG
jgi:hypothetical protein